MYDIGNAHAVEHHLVQGVDRPADDAFHLEVHEQRGGHDVGALVLADRHHSGIHIVQRQCAHGLRIIAFQAHGVAHFVLQGFHLLHVVINGDHFMALLGELYGKVPSEIAEAEHCDLHGAFN